MDTPQKYFPAQVICNEVLAPDIRILTIEPSKPFAVPGPGQFYMVQAGLYDDPLLKRPFSIFRHTADSLSFLYRIRGKGTAWIASLRQGDDIMAIGPLGNSYPAPTGDFIAVAGGIGFASLFSLVTAHKNRAYLFYGARSAGELVMAEDAAACSREIHVATEDGSRGHRGLVTDAVGRFLSERPRIDTGTALYTCGPPAMMKAVASLAADFGMRCYASLEAHMACGVGACLGCVVMTQSGYKRVCKEGTVFDAREVLW